MSGRGSWSEYYEEYEDSEPRPVLFETLERFGPGRRDAVDLGCGSGTDTLAMLERGWRVFATDAEDEAIRRLRARVPAGLAPGLRTEVARMEDVELPPADLVWASFSLFYCRPDRFPDVWGRVRGAVLPEGRFVGHLLGDRDTWAGDDDITALARDEALALFDGLDVERFEEEESDGDAWSVPKHWHVFEISARRPA